MPPSSWARIMSFDWLNDWLMSRCDCDWLLVAGNGCKNDMLLISAVGLSESPPTRTSTDVSSFDDMSFFARLFVDELLNMFITLVCSLLCMLSWLFLKLAFVFSRLVIFFIWFGSFQVSTTFETDFII